MQGDTIYLLVQDSEYDNVRAFASKEDAEEAFHVLLEEALEYSDLESLDDLPEYIPRNSFTAPNGSSAELLGLEVE